MDSIADGVFTVDLDWNVTFFNRAASGITGIEPDEAIGQKCWEVFHSSICDGSCALRECLEHGKSLTNKSIFILRPDGRKVPISISASPLTDRKGKVVGGVETFRDISAIQLMRKQLEGLYTVEDIVTRSQSLIRVLEILPRIAASESTVLLLGESGTGKELMARAIHNQSPRAKGPFVAVNCGALPEHLLESELFGYKAGAFTDAKKDKRGRFQLAKGGTIFLDEIGDLPLPLQVKILRVLQEKEFERVGASKTQKVDVRIVAATNRDLEVEVAAGRFREDLFYRLNVIPIHLPPLRERGDDIMILTEHFLTRFCRLRERERMRFDREARDMFLSYSWPGNVRELENLLERLTILCDGDEIVPGDLPPKIWADAGKVREQPAVAYVEGPRRFSWPTVEDLRERSLGLKELLDEIEDRLLVEALDMASGVKNQAAEILGIKRTTLIEKLKKKNQAAG
jgi:PAS domain S-box-containing protein